MPQRFPLSWVMFEPGIGTESIDERKVLLSWFPGCNLCRRSSKRSEPRSGLGSGVEAPNLFVNSFLPLLPLLWQSQRLLRRPRSTSSTSWEAVSEKGPRTAVGIGEVWPLPVTGGSAPLCTSLMSTYLRLTGSLAEAGRWADSPSSRSQVRRQGDRERSSPPRSCFTQLS